MHSHDRTLLSRLGFSDPDKKEPRHDLACRYLAQPEVAKHIVSMFLLSPRPFSLESTRVYSDEVISRERGMISQAIKMLLNPHFERPIGKGEGQYKTTIGFIDLVLRAEIQENVLSEKSVKEKEKWVVSTADDTTAMRVPIFAEVKIASVSVGEIIRQIHLYREYLTPVVFQNYVNGSWGIPFVLATAFPLSADALQQLKDDHIKHVFLGEKFNKFCDQQKDSPQGEMFEV